MGNVHRNCPDRVLAAPKASKGESSGQNHVAMIVQIGVHAEDSMDMMAVEEDPRDEAIGSVMGTMHGVSVGEGQLYVRIACLPPPFTKSEFKGFSPCQNIQSPSFLQRK